MKFIAYIAIAFAIAYTVSADTYMHNPRGSNNKLNDENQNTQNENRLFDSQNNAKGGYMWGPPLKYYTGSILSIEYTQQHGCGNNGKVHCEMIWQFACEPNMRDGDATQGADARTNYDVNQADDSAANSIRGRHETAQWFQDCEARERNKGLFIADQNLDDTIGARSTRQNAAGNQYGTECPEERDHFPYWHPTPWKDVFITTDNITRCDYYLAESGNTKAKGICSDPQYNNPASCSNGGGTWQESSHNTVPPECLYTMHARDNHNGNGVLGYHNNFNWTIPDEWVCPAGVLRQRYNISTDDFDGWAIDAASNGGNSPIVNDPLVDVGLGVKLQLAINTAQFFRTFEERSHTFEIKARDGDVPGSCTELWNLNVRGRRGNIEQCYPAVEYDYTPQRLHIPIGGCVHIAWTGSDYNAANQAGEGTDQEDRHNIIQLKANNLAANYPEQVGDVTMFNDQALIESLALLDQADATLNDAPAMFDAGVYQWNESGHYHYFCSRNNNFTNRSQKGTLVIGATLSGAAAAAIGIGIALLLTAGVLGGAAMYSKSHPQSQVASIFNRRGSMGSRGSYGSGNGSWGSRGSKGSKFTQQSNYTRR